MSIEISVTINDEEKQCKKILKSFGRFFKYATGAAAGIFLSSVGVSTGLSVLAAASIVGIVYITGKQSDFEEKVMAHLKGNEDGE